MECLVQFIICVIWINNKSFRLTTILCQIDSEVEKRQDEAIAYRSHQMLVCQWHSEGTLHWLRQNYFCAPTNKNCSLKWKIGANARSKSRTFVV